MRVISRKRLRDFGATHPEAVTPLDDWYRIVRRARWQQPSEVVAVLGRTDFIGGTLAVFDIGGNKYRLVVDMWFQGQRVYVKHVFTHKQYDEWNKARR